MSIFTDVKEAVTVKEAAEFYGFSVKSNGMMCCPFHNDKHPSMKVDNRFYCFGCHAKGDVIDFVAGVFHLTLYDAARKLADDFHLLPRPPESAALVPVRPDKKTILPVSWNDRSAFRTMHRYELVLKQWKKDYAPVDRDAEWDEHFVAALQTLPSVSDWVDQLASNDQLTREYAVKDLLADGTLDQIRLFLHKHARPAKSEQAA